MNLTILCIYYLTAYSFNFEYLKIRFTALLESIYATLNLCIQAQLHRYKAGYLLEGCYLGYYGERKNSKNEMLLRDMRYTISIIY